MSGPQYAARRAEAHDVPVPFDVAVIKAGVTPERVPELFDLDQRWPDTIPSVPEFVACLGLALAKARAAGNEALDEWDKRERARAHGPDMDRRTADHERRYRRLYLDLNGEEAQR